MNKFLIIGTGGVGGSIAGFLALAGKDVTCIARGKHLEAIREKGLHLKSDLKGEHYLPVKACTAEEYNEQTDVIFVCVKGYSINSISGCSGTRLASRHLGNPHLECLRNRSPHRPTCSTCNGTRRLHIHCRFRVRHRRNHANGQNIPPCFRSTPRTRNSSRTTGSRC